MRKSTRMRGELKGACFYSTSAYLDPQEMPSLLWPRLNQISCRVLPAMLKNSDGITIAYKL